MRDLLTLILWTIFITGLCTIFAERIATIAARTVIDEQRARAKARSLANLKQRGV